MLSERWDGSKGLRREVATPLDGRDRIQVLKRIAYIAASSSLARNRAEVAAQTQIDLLNFGKVNAREALLETARFYGILVPTEEGWEFVHRTVHDFLAASYWVETGGFAAVKHHTWTARTAYAACLMSDATEIFKAALRAPDGLPVAAEMLSNGAPMSASAVAEALQDYFSRVGLAAAHRVPGSKAVTASLSTDFIRGANSRLLDRLVDAYSKRRAKVTDALLAYCLLELKERGLKLDYVTYDALKTGFLNEGLIFNVLGQGSVELREMSPAVLR